jgi:hypothetical protein
MPGGRRHLSDPDAHRAGTDNRNMGVGANLHGLSK